MWAYRWLLVAGTLCVARGQIAEMSLDPLLSFVTCLRESKPGYCLQERALSYFEGWLATEEEAEENPSDGSADEEEEPGSKLSPYWKKMVDQVAERIAGFYQDDDDDTAGSSKAISGPIPPSASADQQIQLKQARDTKYKKDKKVKVAMTIILLIIYFIKSQLFYMFDKVARTFIFAKLVLAFKIYVIAKAVELKRYLWWVKEEKKEEHHEVSLHDHHWEEPEHFDHHYPPPPVHHGYDHGPPAHYEHHPWGGWHGRRLADQPADPYRAHRPAPSQPPSSSSSPSSGSL